MSILDKDLVRSINSGRAFMLVGSGPSSAAGIPTWTQLAQRAVEVAVRQGGSDHQLELDTLLSEKKFPEVFELSSRAVGLDALCAELNPLLKSGNTGQVYPILASWPIGTYLTTNFDDLLLAALHEQGEAFISRGNTPQELRELRADTESTVFKLHGDLSTSGDVVLTSSQYKEFLDEPKRKYWRDIVFSILRNVDVIVVGYSVSDPNFSEQLRWASEVSAPNKPVYLFATGLSAHEVDELYEKYNVRVLQYDNEDGSHHELVRLLRRYDPFIARRDSGLVGLPDVDEDKAALAGSLHVFTKARIDDEDDTCLERTYCALVLSALSTLELGTSVSLHEVGEIARAKVGSTVDPPVLDRAVEHLYRNGYIGWDAQTGTVQLLAAGEDRINSAFAERNAIEERFDTACRLYLESLPSKPDSEAQKGILDAIKQGIVSAFERRGLEIARATFDDTQIDVSDATDILSVVNERGGTLAALADRAAFADLTIKVLLEPSQEMKNYLASVSQGYFAYHVLGWDAKVTNERLRAAQNHVWVLDSSVLISVLAIQCVNHKYAQELLSRMNELGFRYVTTERLLDEVEGHTRWAIGGYLDKGLDSLELLKGVVVSPGHRQNLFIDGFSSWAEGQGAPTLGRYLEECVGTSKVPELRKSLLGKMAALGIEVRAFDDWPSVAEEPGAYADRDDLVAQIRAERERRGTYRSDDQCIAEAEVILLARWENAAFLTLSNVLKGIAGVDHRVNWQPEALYRFLSLFSIGAQDSETLYESMTQTFYYCGFNIVDRPTVKKFASGLAHQARMQLDEAREEYGAALDDRDFGSLIEDFDTVPDEQKPFYAMQFAHYVAVKAAAKAAAAEKRVATVEARAKLSDKDRDELSKLRAREAERQAKAKKRSRRNQSKPKKGKKGK